MSILKSEVKIGAVHEIGCRLDDNLESVTKEMYKAEGYAAALIQAVSVVDSLNREADKEINDGNLELDAGSRVRSYLSRALNTLNAQLKSAEQNRNVIAGKVQAFQLAVQVTKKFKDDEMAKLQVLQAALAKGFIQQNEQGEIVKKDPDAPRPEGTHPGASMKQRRLVEEVKNIPENSDVEPQAEIKEEAPVVKARTKKGKK